MSDRRQFLLETAEREMHLLRRQLGDAREENRECLLIRADPATLSGLSRKEVEQRLDYEYEKSKQGFLDSLMERLREDNEGAVNG